MRIIELIEAKGTVATRFVELMFVLVATIEVFTVFNKRLETLSVKLVE